MRLLCTLILLLGLSAQAQITISNATLSGVTSGSALLSANQTFTGSNTFSGGMMVWGDANKTNGVWIGPSGEVLSNAVGSVTIAGGNVTASGKLGGDGSGISNVVSCIQVFQGHDTPAFTSVLPKYAPPMGTSTGYDGAEVNLCVPFARAGILTNLFVRTLALGAGTNLVVTIWTNGAASNLTLNYNGIGSLQQASNLTSGVYVPAGCTLSVEMKGNNATANNARILWSFEKLSQ